MLIKQTIELLNVKGAKMDEGFKITLNESLLFTNMKVSTYENMLKKTHELNKEIEIELKNLEN